MRRGLTTADVCEITGYRRDELHAILRCLWPYCDAAPNPRVAREFEPRDLLVLYVTRVLEHDLGLRRVAVGTLGKALQAALSGPRKINPNARLVVTVQPLQVLYVAQNSTDRQGVVVALGPLFERVDTYLSTDVYPSLRLETNVASRKRRHA
jgi:hypothetical protein